MKTIFDFKPGKYYSKEDWSGTGMCVTIGEDFRYKFGIMRDGQFYLLESNFLIDDITEKFFEL